MTWALFLDSTNRPVVDFYAFSRGQRIVGEYVTREEACRARDAWAARQEREEREARGQGELPL